MHANPTQRVSGHVRLVKGKRGEVFYIAYRTPSGKQVKQKLGPAWKEKGRPPAGYFTKKTAKDKLEKTLTEVRSGEIPDRGDRSGHTFGEACDEWLRYCEYEKQRRPSTIRDYRNVVNGSLVPEFSRDLQLNALTTDRIETYRSKRLSKGKVSRRTIQKEMVLLHGILARAKRLKWITTNAAEDVERVTVKPSGDFNVLEPEQIFAVARAAEDAQDAALFTFAAFTGLRLGELRALRWADVDFAKRTVFVRGNYTNASEKRGRQRAGRSARCR